MRILKLLCSSRGYHSLTQRLPLALEGCHTQRHQNCKKDKTHSCSLCSWQSWFSSITLKSKWESFIFSWDNKLEKSDCFEHLSLTSYLKPWWPRGTFRSLHSRKPNHTLQSWQASFSLWKKTLISNHTTEAPSSSNSHIPFLCSRKLLSGKELHVTAKSSCWYLKEGLL